MRNNQKAEQKECLYVQMLGGFELQYKDKEITLRKNVVTKAMHLMQILLYYHQTGISKSKLVECLYGSKMVDDPSNNLRVTSFRMKKMLLDAGFPDAEYIENRDGTYYWDCDIPIYIDVLDFEKKIKTASHERDQEVKMTLLEQACDLYKGVFLPKLSGEYWVLTEGLYYKNMYEDALQELLPYLRENKKYENMLKLSTAACNIDPFGDWQSAKIEALIGLRREKEALKVYKDTAKMLLDELGVKPSEQMVSQIRELGERMQNVPLAIEEIKEQLREDELENGAYYVGLPSFIDSYRLIRRMMERSGQSVFLMLCTLVEDDGTPMTPGNKLQKLSEEFKEVVQSSLRKGDTYTQYSPNQFLIMLPEITEEKCTIISHRITRNFSEGKMYRKHNVEYFCSSLIDLDEDGFGK